MIPLRTSVAVVEPPGATVGILLALVVVFLFQASLPPDLAERFILNNALVPARYAAPSLEAMRGLSATNYLPFLTNTFMHADAWHLVVNAWALWVYGAALEQRLGMARLLALYVVAGLAGSAAHFAVHPTSTVPALGASGAIAGILGGFIVAHRGARISVLALPLPRIVEWPALSFVIVWAALQAVMAIGDLVPFEAPARARGGIAWWAHLGGFAAGLALAALLAARRQPVRIIGPALGGVRAIGRPRAPIEIMGSRGAVPVVAKTAIQTAAAVRLVPESGTTTRRRGGPWSIAKRG